MPTAAHRAGNAKHVKKLDLIKIQPYQEQGEAIRAAAGAASQSVQGYVLQAVRERMEREGQDYPPAPPPEQRGRKAAADKETPPEGE